MLKYFVKCIEFVDYESELIKNTLKFKFTTFFKLIEQIITKFNAVNDDHNHLEST